MMRRPCTKWSRYQPSSTLTIDTPPTLPPESGLSWDVRDVETGTNTPFGAGCYALDGITLIFAP